MFKNINASAQELATANPDRRLLTFLRDGESDAVTVTFGEIDLLARSVAGALLDRIRRGDRVIVALPPGSDYVAVMLGCFYAGAIAVPCPAISRDADLPRIRGIAADCAPTLAVVPDTETVRSRVDIDGLRWESASVLLSHSPLERSQVFQPSPEDLAFLQYTSGSTGAPRGVRVSHHNLAQNSWLIATARGHRPFRLACWLPPHHDMGLIGGVIHPLITGSEVVLMSPLHFLQRPVRWLRAISDHRATHSAAPDFAFRYCVDRISPEERRGLDLSCWELVYCGAEPVRKKTLDLFTEAYSPYGFRREALMPCYGLAEATLIVTAKPIDELPRERAGENGRTLISCGRPLGETELKIVDPTTCDELAESAVGEIWVRGPSVAAGYWRSESGKDSSVFEGRLKAAPQSAYLRTGDLGFMSEGELYVCGREKHLIIVRGKNLHAEDLESTVTESHPALHHVVCAAIPLQREDAEELAILIELEARSDEAIRPALASAARGAVVRYHGVAPVRVAIVRRGSLPRTSSGKIRRFACVELLESGRLPVLYEEARARP